MNMPATLLLVDDEPNVLRSLRRVLRRDSYRILTSESAAAALATLEENEVDLIISDVRMPGMDGASLLSKVRARWPQCMRILLTGYPDLGATINAINHGEIHRYVAKPWSDAELQIVIRQSLDFQFADRDRARLESLTRQQNQQLMAWAAELEQRVKERTARLEATAQLLEQAHAELERSFVTATEVFSSLIHQRLPKSRRTNQEVLGLVRAFCSAKEIAKDSAQDIEMAAALYNLGRLTWRDGMIALAVDQLKKDDRVRYQQYPGIGENLLMGLDPAQKASLSIRHHQERWDGAGFPDGLKEGAIPWEARLLKIIVDYVELQRGMVIARQLTSEEALSLIAGNAGRVYDPDLCAQFIDLVEAMDEQKRSEDASVVSLAPHALIPGMVLAQPLYTDDDVLMLREGTLLTEKLIDRLREFEQSEGNSLVVHIWKPEQNPSVC
ncbi:response regulator [Alcaligenaceae bacterium]|nr:response regulator [Alcaligenaceae bacterium]